MPFRLPRLSSFRPSYDGLRISALTLLYIVVPGDYLLRNHASMHRVAGPSMAPLLSPSYATTGEKDTILIRRSVRLADDPIAEGGTGAKSQLERGMIVAFERPTSAESHMLVKRVVALEGDVVRPAKRWRTFNKKGRSVDVHGRGGQEEELVTVPFGHVWVEGDNSDETVDSNDYGPISKSLITGVATHIVFPAERRGVIDWKRDWKRLYGKRVRKAKGEGKVPEEWAM